MTIATRTAALEAIMSEIVGTPVSLTIRGDREFTFSTEEVCLDLLDRIRSYFGNHASATASHDDECGSFVYLSA